MPCCKRKRALAGRRRCGSLRRICSYHFVNPTPTGESVRSVWIRPELSGSDRHDPRRERHERDRTRDSRFWRAISPDVRFEHVAPGADRANRLRVLEPTRLCRAAVASRTRRASPTPRARGRRPRGTTAARSWRRVARSASGCTCGGRVGFDHNAVFGFAATPRVSMAGVPRRPSDHGTVGDTKLTFNAGTGIKAPSISRSKRHRFSALLSASVAGRHVDLDARCLADWTRAKPQRGPWCRAGVVASAGQGAGDGVRRSLRRSD